MTTIDRTKPCEEKLRWVPLASSERPEAYADGIVMWNPCDGVHHDWEWDGKEFYESETRSNELGSFTHWAIVAGPEPSDDISINWQLWQGSMPERGTRVRSTDGHEGTVERHDPGERRVPVRFDHEPGKVVFVQPEEIGMGERE